MLWAVRWHCRYGMSYRDLGQIMGERGVAVDHSTILPWHTEISTCRNLAEISSGLCCFATSILQNLAADLTSSAAHSSGAGQATAEETEMDEIYETEPHLLYVACNRARDRFLVSAVAPGSNFLANL